MRGSLYGRHQMAWRILGRWCRPTVDTFFTVMLFGVGGTLLTVLWTFEPRQLDQRAADEELQHQLIDQILHEKDQLRKELDRLNNASIDDVSVWNGQSDNRQRNGRRPTENLQRRPRVEVVFDNGEVPENLFRSRDRTRTPSPSVTRYMRDRLLSVNSSRTDLLRRRRLKQLQLRDVTRKPEVDRPIRRFNNTRLLFADGNASSSSLVVSRRWCSVYNTTPDVNESFDCIRLLVKPPTTVCLYSDSEDVHVSRHLRQDGLWEPHIVRLFQNLLFQNPDLGVIDIGAHIGQYSLLAASMGRRVIAIEPNPPSLRRLHKAIKINNVEKQIIVVDNAVSDVRGSFQVGVPPDNQGGAYVRRESDSAPCDQDYRCLSNVTTILMDDLLELVDFRRAVMKIDIEGQEHRAFFHADRLFDNINVGYIFMEWIKLRAFYGAEVDDSEDKRRVQRLVDWFTRRGYTAHSLVLFQMLNPDYWYGWPEDIFWQHRDVDPFL